MGLFSRFTFNQQQGSTLHSSGIVDGASLGSTSTQSFQQRRIIDQNRQHVASYRDAGVLHAYRQNAQRAVADTTSRQAADGAVATPAAQDLRHARGRTTPRTSRVENRATSRIDIVKTSRRDAPANPVMTRQTAGFREPQARGYNPYS